VQEEPLLRSRVRRLRPDLRRSGCVRPDVRCSGRVRSDLRRSHGRLLPLIPDA